MTAFWQTLKKAVMQRKWLMNVWIEFQAVSLNVSAQQAIVTPLELVFKLGQLALYFRFWNNPYTF